MQRNSDGLKWNMIASLPVNSSSLVEFYEEENHSNNWLNTLGLLPEYPVNNSTWRKYEKLMKLQGIDWKYEKFKVMRGVTDKYDDRKNQCMQKKTCSSHSLYVARFSNWFHWAFSNTDIGLFIFKSKFISYAGHLSYFQSLSSNSIGFWHFLNYYELPYTPAREATHSD